MAAVLSLGSAASAQFVTYPDRATFDAATSTVTEGFDGGTTPPGMFTQFDGPLDDQSDNAAFGPGDVVDGFAITSSPVVGLIAVGGGLVGNTNTVVGPNRFEDDLSVAFSPAVEAVAFDLYSNTPGTYEITITLVGGNTQVEMVTGATNDFVFFGATSTVGIESVAFSGGLADGELLDNLSFGGFAVTPTAVPTATATPLPPTATPTDVPPTASPTQPMVTATATSIATPTMVDGNPTPTATATATADPGNGGSMPCCAVGVEGLLLALTLAGWLTWSRRVR